MTTTQVGASARRTRAVTRRDIELSTAIGGDRDPVHYDEALAARSRFGGIVVQGGVTSGLLNALVAEQLPGPGSVFLDGTAVRLARPRGRRCHLTHHISDQSRRRSAVYDALTNPTPVHIHVVTG